MSIEPTKKGKEIEENAIQHVQRNGFKISGNTNLP